MAFIVARSQRARHGCCLRLGCHRHLHGRHFNVPAFKYSSSSTLAPRKRSAYRCFPTRPQDLCPLPAACGRTYATSTHRVACRALAAIFGQHIAGEPQEQWFSQPLCPDHPPCRKASKRVRADCSGRTYMRAIPPVPGRWSAAATAAADHHRRHCLPRPHEVHRHCTGQTPVSADRAAVRSGTGRHTGRCSAYAMPICWQHGPSESSSIIALAIRTRSPAMLAGPLTCSTAS